jgi:hypothetical protein
MTIAERSVILLAVPLIALPGPGVFARFQCSIVETRSHFVAETQVGSLAALGDIPRSFAELRVNARGFLPAPGAAVRLSVRAAIKKVERQVTRVSRWISL